MYIHNTRKKDPSSSLFPTDRPCEEIGEQCQDAIKFHQPRVLTINLLMLKFETINKHHYKRKNTNN